MGAPVQPDPGRVDRENSMVVHDHGPEVHEQRVVADYGAEQRAQLSRVTNLVGFVFGLLVALIIVRVLLSAIGANLNNGFAQFIYNVTGVFVAPFASLAASPVYGGATLEISSLVAAIACALLGWAIVKLIWLLLYRPTTSEVDSTTYHRS